MKLIHNGLHGGIIVSQNSLMANRKRKTTVDRHKPSRQIRLNLRLSVQVEKLADRNATSVTQEVNRAVRELLEREKLWPPSREEEAK